MHRSTHRTNWDWNACLSQHAAKRPPGWGHEEQTALSLPTSTPHPRQHKTGTKMFMNVAILTTEAFLFCQDNDSKVRMLLTGFGSTFGYRGETLITVYHTTVFRQYTALFLITTEEWWKEWMLVIPKLFLISLKIQFRISFSAFCWDKYYLESVFRIFKIWSRSLWLCARFCCVTTELLYFIHLYTLRHPFLDQWVNKCNWVKYLCWK